MAEKTETEEIEKDKLVTNETEPSTPENIEKEVEKLFDARFSSSSPSHAPSAFRVFKRFIWKNVFRVLNLRYASVMGFEISQVLKKETYKYAEYPSNPSLYELDLLIPKDIQPFSTHLVFFHGGGYVVGDKSWYEPVVSYFVKEGFPVVNGNYPLAPEFPFPTQIKASLQMLLWLKKMKNITQISLMGDSAGGGLVLFIGLLLYNPAMIQFIFGSDFQVSKDDFPNVKCVIDIYGTNDRATLNEKASYLLKEYIPESQGGLNFSELTPKNCGTPYDLLTYHVSNFSNTPLSLCPVLFVTSSGDMLHNSTLKIIEMLKEMQFLNFEIFSIPGLSHGFFNYYWKVEARQTYEKIIEFLKKSSK